VRRDATEPGDVWLATATTSPSARAFETPQSAAPSIPGARLQQLTGNAAALRRARTLVEPQPFEVPCPAGHTVRGWMFRARTSARRAPLIVMIHGGPYSMYGWSFMHEFQVLAQNGYHVAALNVRGSTGYGRDYLRALVGTWGSRDFEDVMRVTDALERLPFVDPTRIALAGGSYGGYLTAWTIAHTPRYATAVAMRGLYNFTSMFGTSDLGPELVHEFENQTPWESIDRWWRVSPLAQVRNMRTPLLILHADEDLRCPVSQAEEMFNALRVLDRDVELVRFAGEGHDLSRSGKPRHRVARLEILLDWFDRKL
jgi:dipeptidyl aminopeptidase/acylaminoacyl peptidase